ncbi:hypothetical protein STRIP9103_09140 [Streptomyces ipomoeae 91-03]|uniref:Uncharacterized protein n=1 Tax=Streptomyces ipomoeae 91-03 TaxID=698759 RepID=L1KLY3_9ACTN|nr:hypothetical protein STRIP9103_09140 [Streptomyces ipomoeae 91-03]
MAVEVQVAAGDDVHGDAREFLARRGRADLANEVLVAEALMPHHPAHLLCGLPGERGERCLAVDVEPQGQDVRHHARSGLGDRTHSGAHRQVHHDVRRAVHRADIRRHRRDDHGGAPHTGRVRRAVQPGQLDAHLVGAHTTAGHLGRVPADARPAGQQGRAEALLGPLQPEPPVGGVVGGLLVRQLRVDQAGEGAVSGVRYHLAAHQGAVDLRDPLFDEGERRDVAHDLVVLLMPPEVVRAEGEQRVVEQRPPVGGVGAVPVGVDPGVGRRARIVRAGEVDDRQFPCERRIRHLPHQRAVGDEVRVQGVRLRDHPP